jgi:drug/metabolite transporter (DMT)-like permease
VTLPNPGEIAALGTAVCWTFTALAFEAAGKRVGSLAVNIIRLALAALFLALFGWIVHARPLPLDADANAWIWLSLSGVVGFVIGDGALFRALVLIGPRLSTLVMSLAPLWAAFLGWILLDEVLTPLDGLGVGLTIFGVSWVVLERRPAADGKSQSLSKTGLFLAFVGAAGQGTQIRVFAGIAGFALLFVFLGWWRRVFEAAKNREAMKFTSIGAFFGPFLGVSLSLTAAQRIPTGVAQTIMSIVPVLIIPFVILIHHERVSLRAVAGAVLAVVGVGILFL